MRRIALLAAALALASCRHAPPAQPAAAPVSLSDHPEVAACRANPAACHPAALRALRGEGAFQGDWAGAAFLFAGCEGGHPASCADLGALLEEGRGVAADLGRACELGRTKACVRARRSPPFAPAARTDPLPPPLPARTAAPPDPADAARFAGWAWAALYPEQHAALGLTREALAARPPAPADERALLGLVASRRMRGLEACVPASVTGGEARVAAVAAFRVGAGGKVEEPAVRVKLAAPAALAEGWERCAEAALAGWALPLAPSGGRLWLGFQGSGPAVAADGEGWPMAAGTGLHAPALVDPACFHDHLSMPYGDLGWSGDAVARLTVRADGRPAWFSMTARGGVPPGVVEAAWKAVQRCAWRPGRDALGASALVWRVMPLRFREGE
ncbi:MAG: hypothetical protein QM704_10755 [Anaeromyxobacteraceae bacterium]